MPRIRVSADTRERVLERIEQLAGEGLDVAPFLLEAGRQLRRAVPLHPGILPNPSWMTIDPASLLLTSAVAHADQDMSACDMTTEQWAEFEYSSDMPGNRLSDVVRASGGVQTSTELYEAHPDRADEYRELLAHIGVEHEALVALQARDGKHWGAFYLIREPGMPDFDADELEFLRRVSPHLADGVRRGLLLGEATEPDGPDAPAVVVLSNGLDPESLTPGAEEWFADLSDMQPDGLPLSVVSVARAAMGRDDNDAQPTSARVRSASRGWVMVHGQVLAGTGGRRVAVTLQPAGPERITPLLMSAYGLTEREEEITRHVLQGGSTAEIARALTISPYTVQQHLKNIFEKTSVNSRSQLSGRVFLRHYGPRVEDNDERVERARPIRGGPFPDRPHRKTGTTAPAP